jgi:hypothetical protein
MASTECAFNPRVAVDPQGDAIATWQNDKGTVDFGTVEADLRPANSSAWDVPVALSGPGIQAQEPRVALDALDEAIVVWSSMNGDENRIEATARPQTTGAWQAPVTLSGSPVREPNIGENAQVAIDVQGDDFAAWDQSNGSDYVVDAAGRRRPLGFGRHRWCFRLPARTRMSRRWPCSHRETRSRPGKCRPKVPRWKLPATTAGTDYRRARSPEKGYGRPARLLLGLSAGGVVGTRIY